MSNEDLKIIPQIDHQVERITLLIDAPIYGPGGPSASETLLGLIEDDSEVKLLSVEDCANLTLVDLR